MTFSLFKRLRQRKRLEASYPDYPAGYFYESVACFEQYLLEDPPQAATFKTFVALNEVARQKAESLTNASPAWGHYYQGAALGYLARAYVSQKKYMQAVPKAWDGAGSHFAKSNTSLTLAWRMPI